MRVNIDSQGPNRWRERPGATATDALFARAFADAALVPAYVAARILGLDEKTFGALVEAGAIRYVLVGPRTRRYAEADLRAFLARETELACPSTSPRRAATGTTISSIRGGGFMEARAKRLSVVRSK